MPLGLPLNSERIPLAFLADSLEIPLACRVDSLRIPLANFLRVPVFVQENLLQIRLSFPLLEILKEPSIDRFAVLNEPVVLGILKLLSKG